MAEKIAFLFGTKRYLSNVAPPAPQGSVNVVWTSDGENISASVPAGGGGEGAVSSVFGRTGAVVATAGDYTAAQVTGAVDQGSQYANPSWITSLAWSKVTGAPAPISQTPWTQDIDGAGYSLSNALAVKVNDRFVLRSAYGYLGLNVEHSDTWRYSTLGPAAFFRVYGNQFELWTVSAGAAGAIASMNRSFWDDGASFGLERILYLSGLTNNPRKVQIQGAGDIQADFYRSDGGADDKCARVISRGASIGLERVNDAYSTVLSHLTLDRFAIYTNVPISCAALTCTALPSSNPGAGTKKLWYDPADGNRVKFAA